MTNGNDPVKQTENPIDLVSPGDFPAISDVYEAHGRASDGKSTFMGALDNYFEEHGQTRTEGGNYRPRMHDGSDELSVTSVFGSPAGIALEYSTICSLLRQLGRAKRKAGANANVSNISEIESKIRDIEANLGYGNLESKGYYLWDLLYFDSDLEKFLKEGAGQTTDTPRDIVEYRQGMQEAEAALTQTASALQDALFAEWERHETAKAAFEDNLRTQGVDPGPLDVADWVPDYAVTNALGLYPFERQVEVIDRMTESLEKHGQGAAILLEILRTGVPFDPLALFSVPINHGQMRQFFQAPRPLKKNGDSWEFVSWEEASDDPTVWSRIGPIIADPLDDGASSAVSETFEEVQSQYTMTGIQKKYRIRAGTDLGGRLAKIAQRFVSAVTSTLRGYQDSYSLDSDEEQRVEELCGYLAVLTNAFVDPDQINSKLSGNTKLEHLAGKIPGTTAERSNASQSSLRARAKFKENVNVKQTLPTFQKTLDTVHQVQSLIGDLLGARLEALKEGIKQDIDNNQITIPASQSIDQYLDKNTNWRNHNSELFRANRRFTHLNTLTSALQVGFTVVDNARFNQDYDLQEFIRNTTGTFATAGSVAADIDSYIAQNAQNRAAYDTDLFIKRGLGEVAGQVADTVDVAITIKSASVSSYTSIKVGNGIQAVETSTTALVSIGSVAAGYAIGGPVGAVVGAILDIVGTLIVDALFEDISDVEEWARCTVFGTGLPEMSNAWGPWNAFDPATGSPAVQFETESSTWGGFTYFGWDQNAIRRVVGYYNLTMGFNVDTYEYGAVLPRASNPDREMKIVLKDIAFGQTDSKVAVCPVRWVNDQQCVVDPPYMVLELSSGRQEVTVNPAGLYGMPTKDVIVRCETNGSVQSPAPSKDWVHDVWAFEAYYKTGPSGRPVVWPPSNPQDTRGEFWGFELVHLLPTIPGGKAETLDKHFDYSSEDAMNSIENVPHPRDWIEPDGLWEYPP